MLSTSGQRRTLAAHGRILHNDDLNHRQHQPDAGHVNGQTRKRIAGAGAKLALWAHNGHVRRAPGSMGEFLSAHLRREDMVVVGFATGSGTYRAWGGEGPERFSLEPPIAGSVEAALHGSAPAQSVLDLRTTRDGSRQWFNALRPHRLIGGGEATNQFVNQRRVASDYDLLVWFAQTSATTAFNGVDR